MRTSGEHDLLALLRGLPSATRREFLRRALLAGWGFAAAGAVALAERHGGTGTAEASDVAGSARAGRPAEVAARPPRAPKRGGTFVTMSHQDVLALSPDDARQAGFRAVIANIHEGLLKVDENYQIVPVLAQSYEVSADGRTWTFSLRPGVRWHDGTPFTSEDVKYNFEWVMNPENAQIGQPLFADVVRVDTPDPMTVVVTLKAPNAPFAALTATRLLVPKHYHQRVGDAAYKQAPMGTGPWKLQEFKPASVTLLAANDDYWGGRPWIDYWRQDVVPEPSVRAVALRTGDADATTWPLAPEDILRFQDDPRFRTYRAPGAVINHFPLNNKFPLFTDKRVRQAMLYAMDRDALVNDLMKGLAVKATSNLSPALTYWYEPDVKQYPYDPDRARALLREAGWTPGADGVLTNANGEKFQINCIVFTGDALRRSEAEIVQHYFRDVGIDMRLREMEVGVGITAGRKGEYELGVWNTYYGGDGGDPDARDGLKSGAVNNFPQWSNPEADRLLDAGAAETDPERRRKIYSDLQKLVAEEVPFLFVMFWENAFQFNRRIKGMPERATNPAWLFQEVHKYWIEEE